MGCLVADGARTRTVRGGSAVLSSRASWEGRRGGEDPWLCDPGFRRVCSWSKCSATLGRRTGSRN